MTPAGWTPAPTVVGAEERHERMVRSLEWDVCEFSVSQYLTLRQRGGCGFTAIPVFPRRIFGQRLLFCRNDGAIRRPEDLAGRRAVISRYQNSVALWVRGYLKHEFGVAPEQIEWLRLREEAFDFDLPRGIRVRDLPRGSSVDRLLETGETDAVMLPSVPPAFRRGEPFVRRIFLDVRAVEIEYFRRTRDFPILHTLVVRDALLARMPGIAESIRQLFEDSKRWYYEYSAQPGALAQPFGSLGREEEIALMGPDPYPYNVLDNAASLEVLTLYAWEQGLIPKRPEISALFFSERHER